MSQEDAIWTLAERAERAAELAPRLQAEIVRRIDPDDDDSLDQLIEDLLDEFPDADGEDIADATNAVCEMLVRAGAERGDEEMDAETSIEFLAKHGDEDARRMLDALKELSE